MGDDAAGPITVHAANVDLIADTRLPATFDSYVTHAAFVEASDLESGDGSTLFVAVRFEAEWPEVVIALRYSPAGFGFTPGIAFVPETTTLFIGAGTTLLCYSLGGTPRRLWADEAEIGFLGWRRHGDTLLMSAEVELAAWDTSGRKLWTTFVEPPWTYAVVDDRVRLDVMGTVCELDLVSGPSWTELPWR